MVEAGARATAPGQRVHPDAESAGASGAARGGSPLPPAPPPPASHGAEEGASTDSAGTDLPAPSRLPQQGLLQQADRDADYTRRIAGLFETIGSCLDRTEDGQPGFANPYCRVGHKYRAVSADPRPSDGHCCGAPALWPERSSSSAGPAPQPMCRFIERTQASLRLATRVLVRMPEDHC